MQISIAQVRYVLSRARQVSEHLKSYCIAGDNIPVSIEDLQWTICDMYQLTVEKFQVFKETRHVQASVGRYPTSATILVVAGLSDNEKRYAATKELCHLMLDKEADWLPDPRELIRQYLNEVRVEIKNGRSDNEVHRALVSEAMAELAATEILYPTECRLSDMEGVLNNTISYAALEARYRIPQLNIEMAHSEEYRALFDITEASD